MLLCLLSSSLFLLFKDQNAHVYTYPDDDPLTHPYFCNDSFFGQWCLSDVELTRNTYVYFAIQEGIMFVVSLYIFFSIKKFPMAHLIFAIVNGLALLDYLTSYQKTWFYVGSAPISWNILKVVIFTLAIINEVFLLVEQRLMEERNG